jgi:hypothetical protein
VRAGNSRNIPSILSSRNEALLKEHSREGDDGGGSDSEYTRGDHRPIAIEGDGDHDEGQFATSLDEMTEDIEDAPSKVKMGSVEYCNIMYSQLYTSNLLPSPWITNSKEYSVFCGDISEAEHLTSEKASTDAYKSKNAVFDWYWYAHL